MSNLLFNMLHIDDNFHVIIYKKDNELFYKKKDDVIIED